MTNIESSVIKQIGVKDNDLLLVFKTGATYSYAGAACEYCNILEAQSAGAYFNGIKLKYDCTYLGKNITL